MVSERSYAKSLREKARKGWLARQRAERLWNQGLADFMRIKAAVEQELKELSQVSAFNADIPYVPHSSAFVIEGDWGWTYSDLFVLPIDDGG